jgi:ribonucleotide reductase beta subunit family protein with ferritin-like domain
MIDPILDKSLTRYTLMPIKHWNLWDLYKKQLAMIWTREEIDFSHDLQDYLDLDLDTQHIIKMILAFFASMDSIVNINIEKNLIDNIVPIEAQSCYRFQVFMETIHAETYAIMIESLITDEVEKQYLLESIHTIPSIKSIHDVAFKWIDSDTPISYKLIAFACIEGILFSGAFAVIYWIKNYKNNGGIFLSGLMKSNELIARDEGLHVEFAVEVFSMLQDKPNEIQINNIIKEFVEITKVFNCDAIPTKLIGISQDTMNSYTEYVADRLVLSLGYSKIYNSKNPFTFMDTIGMVQKTNFHESRPTEYKKATFTDEALALSEDF